MTQRQNVRIGKIGEYLAAATLESIDISCDIIRQDGFDILAYLKDKIIRVQVKSTLTAKKTNDRGKVKYSFYCAKNSNKTLLDIGDCDVIALVAIDIKRVKFIPITDLNAKHHRLDPEVFEPKNLESESWDDSIRSIAKSSALRNNRRRGKPKRDRQFPSADDASD